ncbi:MAG: hypothetical protein ACRD0O_03625 [Acidimicrobiia bacterium]
MDFWQNLLDDTMDFIDDSIDRVRDDDWDDLEDDVEELQQAIAALNTKLDKLLARGVGVADVRDTESASSKSMAKSHS